ncbi:hypothetical protein [Nonomuraea africana]|uniref:hypothetical protein n=1 Tax=Nonomuraea africana TaxID=46171 RepID=UPI00298F3503|nr:hypothetical protein [Nonomuraea africana]
MRAFAVTVLALAVLGVPAGLVWSLIAPRAPYAITGDGPVLADPSTQTLIAADGWYAVVTGVPALACAVVAWNLARTRRLEVLLGLAAGGGIAAFVTLWVGTTFTLGTVTVEAQAIGPGVKVVAGALELTAKGVLVTWPLLAVGLYGTMEAIVAYRESPLRRPYGEIERL